MSLSPYRAEILKHGDRGCETWTTAPPTRKTSPMQTSVSTNPLVVKFSPNAPLGGNSRPQSSSQKE